MPVPGSDAAVPNTEPPLLPGRCIVSMKSIGVNSPRFLVPRRRSRKASRSSGVMLLKGLMSSSVKVSLLNGGTTVGNGCVGQLFSPGMPLIGTGRSSIGQIGSPVTRSNT